MPDLVHTVREACRLRSPTAVSASQGLYEQAFGWWCFCHTGVNLEEGYPQIGSPIHMWTRPVDNSGDNPAQSCGPLRAGWGSVAGRSRARSPVRRYFHCVETPNPAAMKPKPTTMFQLPSLSMGSEPSVT
ncbi:hypothetical protein GCM10010233_20080 [Streptomyces pseudogriseolus]|nr:hypothetical protein GCM10010233_20080 [Streptomyces gancidicus]